MGLCYLSQMCEAPHLNMHGQLPSGARCIHFGLSLYLHNCVCVHHTRSEGSGNTVHMHSRLWALLGQIFDKHKKSNELANFFTTYKSSYGIYWKLITTQLMNFGTTRACVNSLIKHAWTATKKS